MVVERELGISVGFERFKMVVKSSEGWVCLKRGTNVQTQLPYIYDVLSRVTFSMGLKRESKEFRWTLTSTHSEHPVTLSSYEPLILDRRE